MSQAGIIVLLSQTLVFGTWVFIFEMRFRKLTSQLTASEEKNKDEEIVEAVHSLSDDDLNSQMSDFVGGTKPKT